MPRERKKRKFNYRLYGRSFGSSVRDCRITLGWTLRQCSALVDIDHATLCGVEYGHRGLPDEQFDRLIDALTEASRTHGLHFTRSVFLRRAGLSDETSTASVHRVQETVAIPRQEFGPTETQPPALTDWQQALAQSEKLRQLALEASSHGDWELWAQYTVRSGIIAMDLGDLRGGKECFERVMNRHESDPELQISESILIDSRVRLGTVYLESGAFPKAIQILEAVTRYPKEPRPGSLTDGGMHWLGRANSAFGLAEQDLTRVARGINLLRASQKASRYYHDPETEGFNLLNQVLPLATIGDSMKPSLRAFDEGAELLGDQGRVAGHIMRTKAEVFMHFGLSRKARQYLEEAEQAYLTQGFSQSGVSAIYRARAEMSVDNARQAIAYALCATVLWPYAASLEVLNWTVDNLFWALDGGANTVRKVVREVEEELRGMDKDPFLSLKALYAFMGGSAASYIERGLEVAARAISRRLREGVN